MLSKPVCAVVEPIGVGVLIASASPSDAWLKFGSCLSVHSGKVGCLPLTAHNFAHRPLLLAPLCTPQPLLKVLYGAVAHALAWSACWRDRP